MYPPNTPHEGKPPSPEAEPTGGGPGGDPLVTLPYTEDFIKDFFKEIEKAQRRRDDYAKEWDILIKEYCPEVKASGDPEVTKTNIHFRNVHTKLSQIFYQLPELILEPRGPMRDPVAISPVTGQPITAEDAVAIKREVLNFKLGEDGIDASWLMDEVLTDCLLWSGIGAIKVGYKAYTKSVQEPIMVPDPNFMPPPSGDILGLGPAPQPPMIPLTDPTGEPVTRTVDVPIYEEWYGKRVSAKKILFSNDLRSGRVDNDACWIGMEFWLTGPQLKSQFNFDPESLHLTASASDKQVADTPRESQDERKRYHGYELWCRASEYDPNQPHPLAVYQLVLLDGVVNKPVVYRPSPDQTFDEMGRLTVDSMVGFPIEICSLRDHPDSPYVYSDAAFVNGPVKQVNTHRQQSVRLRDAAIAKMLYDEGAFTKEEIERIRQMKVGDFMAVQEGKLAQGADKLIAQATQPTAARDDYRLAQTIKQDIDEAIGISAAEAGVMDNESAKTATEVATAGSKANARLAKDRQRATKFFLRFVRKFDALLMRYATSNDYIQIAGRMGEQRLMVWNNKIISGPCAYRIKPDSQLMIDAARDRQQLLIYLDKVIADPLVNRYPIHKKLARLFGLDPSEVLLDPVMVQLMQAGGLNTPAPGGKTGPSSDTGPAADRRPHVATGGRPNAPEPGSGTTPNVARI